MQDLGGQIVRNGIFTHLRSLVFWLPLNELEGAPTLGTREKCQLLADCNLTAWRHWILHTRPLKHFHRESLTHGWVAHLGKHVCLNSEFKNGPQAVCRALTPIFVVAKLWNYNFRVHHIMTLGPKILFPIDLHNDDTSVNQWIHIWNITIPEILLVYQILSIPVWKIWVISYGGNQAFLDSFATEQFS